MAQSLEVGKRHIKLIAHKIQSHRLTYTFLSVSIMMEQVKDSLNLTSLCIPYC
jgi:hypothetical protein